VAVTAGSRLGRWAWASLRGAGWAPLAVFLAHISLAPFWPGMPGPDFDQISHVAGGLAMAYFLARALREAETTGGYPPTPAPLAAAGVFCATVTVAVGWEFAEHMVDRWFGSRLQASQADTMLDLLLGMVGAAIYLGASALYRGAAGRPRPSA